MPNPSVIGLALLKVNWDAKGSDYISNFSPLVAEAIRLSGRTEIFPAEVQDQLKTSFGLNIPINVVKTILRRTAKQGFIKYDNKKESYIPNRTKLASTNFAEIQQEVINKHDLLITQLYEYGKQHHQLDWSENDAEASLLAYLDEYQLALLTGEYKSGVIPTPQPLKKKTLYVVGMFIRHVQDGDGEALAFLDTVLKGNFIANAIFLPDPGRIQKNFRNTDVYLDTAFLIFALGYSGKTREAPCVELLQLLYEAGANLKCFQHTLAEIRGALDACASLLSPALRGRPMSGPIVPTLEFFLQMGYRESDILLLGATLEKSLRALKVHVVDRPPYIKDFVIDEKALTDYLSKEIRYHNEQALTRDVDSIAAIQRIREWNEFIYVEECKAIFVTTNTALAKFTAEFYYRDAQRTSVAPCITDYTLTNLIWLKKPLSAPDLPRKRINADYFAAIQPSDKLWHRYQEEISKLERQKSISEEDYFLLRYTLEAKTALMDLTQGEEGELTKELIPAILQAARDKIRDEVSDELTESEGQRRLAEEEIRKLNLHLSNQERAVKLRASKYSSAFIRVFSIFILILLLFGALTTLFGVDRFRNTNLAYFLAVLQILIIVGGCMSFYNGTTVVSFLRRWEISLANYIERTFLRFLGLS